jgi:hypothetical protein
MLKAHFPKDTHGRRETRSCWLEQGPGARRWGPPRRALYPDDFFPPMGESVRYGIFGVLQYHTSGRWSVASGVPATFISHLKNL